MSESASGGVRERFSSLVTQLRLALGFLTILPVMPRAPASAETVAASLSWFSLVGFSLGAILALEDFFLARLFGPIVLSMIVILTLTVVTGAVHLDGLADTADALGAGRDRERALAIMRDSRVGTFGAIALFFALALKVSALASLGGWTRYAALWMACGLSRWAMVAVGSGVVYLRSDGAGSALMPSAKRTLIYASAIAIAATLVVIRIHGALRASAAAALAVLALRSFYMRWLGGVTGDLIGAAGELIETIVLLAFAG